MFFEVQSLNVVGTEKLSVSKFRKVGRIGFKISKPLF